MTIVAIAVGQRHRPGRRRRAVEDQLGAFQANEMILVNATGPEDDRALAAAASELRSRLRGKFRWVLSGPAAR